MSLGFFRILIRKVLQICHKTNNRSIKTIFARLPHIQMMYDVHYNVYVFSQLETQLFEI